jgi:hypothetical protein
MTPVTNLIVLKSNACIEFESRFLATEIFYAVHFGLRYIIIVQSLYTTKVKGKAFPLQSWTDPWGSRSLRLQNF